MAVQAHNPSSILPEFPSSRTTPTLPSIVDSRLFLSPLPYGSSSPLLDDCQQLLPSIPLVQSQQPQRLFHPVAAPMTAATIPNFALFHQPVVDATTNATKARKRRRESTTDRRSTQPNQQHVPLPLVDHLNHHASGSSPPTGLVSTGLRLAFDDERSIVTSSRPDVGTSVSTLRDELSAQLSQQQEELQQLLKNQADQLRQVLEESRQRHSKSLLSSIEESLSQQLRERELDLGRANRRNLELEEQMKILSMESHMWQSKARSSEAMVAVLRTNLQQAVVQSKEGGGDSEADDAASVHLDENAAASIHKQGEFMRACRKCRVKEVSVLLLPCLHLCLCNDCKEDVMKCPICNTLKTASVEVYLS